MGDTKGRLDARAARCVHGRVHVGEAALDLVASFRGVLKVGDLGAVLVEVSELSTSISLWGLAVRSHEGRRPGSHSGASADRGDREAAPCCEGAAARGALALLGSLNLPALLLFPPQPE